MSFWRPLARGLNGLTNRGKADRDISDEVGDYLERATAALLAEGRSPDEARRTALLELGNMTAVREQVRSYGWENRIERLIDSLRYAVRRLRSSPGFTAVSVLMLALGIGASTAIFSIIDGVVLKPLPYPHAEQLVSLRHTAPGINIKELNMAPSLYFTYSDENRVFQDLCLWSTSTSSVTGVGEPEEVPVLMVTAGLPQVLEIEPALGRAFNATDGDPKSTPTVMLSDGYWRSHFGGDRSVLGRQMRIDGDTSEVIGILPPSFQFMDEKFSLLMPLQFDRANVRLVNFGFRGIARLKPGVTIAQANADIARMLPMVPARFAPNPGLRPKAFEGARIAPNLLFLQDDLVGDSGDTLWVFMATAGIVLLIACANVANLSLVRADGRQQELAIRAALGAGWTRIAWELLLESLLLGVVGGAVGVALAYAALRTLRASDLGDLPRLSSVSIDLPVLEFALATSLLSGLFFGLIPAVKYARPHLLNALKSGGRSLSQSKDRQRGRSVLVVVQMALALVLLVSSGLMIRTFQALHHIDPGFSKPKQVQILNISIPEAQAKEPERVIHTEEEILRKIKGLPGVSSVAITNTAPMEGGSNDTVYVKDQVYREGTLPAIRRYKYVSPGYISTIGSRLIAGRDLTWTETYQQAPVALISENFARELWREPRAALGKHIRPTLKDDWREVVGVVADLHDKGVDRVAPTIAYWALWQNNFDGAKVRVQRNVAFAIRTPRAGSTALSQEIRRAVWSVNPSLPVANLRTLEEIYDRSLARTSFTLALLAVAGGMALLLGVVGMYGVISYAVSQRTREIGIRLALGAPLQEVARMFARHGLVLSGIGAACGLAAAFALTRLMKSLLFDVSPADPLTFAAAAGGLILAVMLARYLPARRATRVDPVEVLRAE
jgi:putative ABC transport system permease protein